MELSIDITSVIERCYLLLSEGQTIIVYLRLNVGH